MTIVLTDHYPLTGAACSYWKMMQFGIIRTWSALYRFGHANQLKHISKHHGDNQLYSRTFGRHVFCLLQLQFPL